MSWRHVMTSQNLIYHLPISSCRCARKLILFLFPWFVVSISSKMLLIIYLFEVMTSRHHVMTSTNPDVPISVCRCARKVILFCFHVFLGNWVQNCQRFFLFICRHVMTSCHDVTKSASSISACGWARMMISFYVSMVLTGYWFSRMFIIHVFLWWHHVITLRHDVTSLLSVTTLILSYLVVDAIKIIPI